MRLTKYILMAGVGMLTLASCSKNFIEGVKPTDGSLPSDIVLSSKIGVNNALTGIYENIRDYIPSTGRQNMYGWKTAQFNFDMRADDLISDPANWWLYENDWTDNSYGRIATSARTLQIWALNYKVINNANAVIAAVPKLPETQDVKDALTGEAEALRAWAYFNLVRVYQFTYSKDTTAPGVPIYLETSTSSTAGNPRAHVSAVYAQIVSDLEDAVTKMTSDRVDKYRINKAVAQGILAQVYLEMAPADNSLWAKAQSNAEAAAADFPLMDAAGYSDGFNSVSNNEWMWGLQFNASQSYSYAGFFGYIEPTDITGAAGRYNDIYVNSTFVNLFTATDIRNLFDNASGQSSSSPWKKFVTLKFRDNATQSGDYVMMRSAEMYLIQAEALAQQGQQQAAIDKLFELQGERDPSATKSTAPDKQTLINEILVERRKELYAEGGVPYFDMKRYQLPLVRTGIQWSKKNIPAADNRWRWQLPQSEMDANKSLTTADQNPL
jgi:hypothetical protein